MGAVFIGLLVIGAAGVVVVGAILGIVAFMRTRTNAKGRDAELLARLDYLELSVRSLIKRTKALEDTAKKSEKPAAEPEPVRPAPPPDEVPPISEVLLPVQEQRAAPAAAAPPALEAPSARSRRTDGSTLLPSDVSSPAAPSEGWGNFEEAVGKRWITWAGALVLFLGVGFFVKYAFDNEWLGPTARVALGILTGVALLVAGDRFVRRTWRALGLALLGAGIAVLYVSVFTAFSIYHLLPQEAAFGALVVVTMAGVALALLHDAVSVSVLSVLGGLLTPLMVSTGVNARDGLFAYLLMLDLGVIAVAFFRRWRALDALAFAGSWALFAGWFHEFYDASAVSPVLAWLAAFYLVFLILPFAWHLRRASPVTVERFLMALLNAAVAFGYAWKILNADHQAVLGFVAIGMSGCYVALGALARRRIPADGRSLLGFVSLAVTFLTMAVPLHLGLHGITLAWALEAPVLLYLGYRYAYSPLRAGAFLVLVVAVCRLFFAHWPLHEAYFTPVFNASFASALSVAAAGGAFALVHRRFAAAAGETDQLIKTAVAIAAGVLAVFLANAEAVSWFRFALMEGLARDAPAVVWAAGAMAFYAAGRRLGSAGARLTGVLMLVAAAGGAARAYLDPYGTPQAIVVNARFAAALVVALSCFAYAWLIRRSPEADSDRAFSPALSGAGAVFLLCLFSAEAWSYFHGTAGDRAHAEWTAQMALSIVWGGYAASCLVAGFARRVRPPRLAALALFGLTALKLVVVDMATVRQIYRIVSFIVIGMLMIGASYLYHRLEVRLTQPTDDKK